MKFCTNCGAQLNDTAQFCTNCGAKLAKTAQRKTSHPKQKVLKFFASGANNQFGSAVSSLVTGERNLTIGEMITIYPENVDIQLTEFKTTPCKIDIGKSSVNVMIGKKQIGYIRDNTGENTSAIATRLIKENRIESVTVAIAGGKVARWSKNADNTFNIEITEKHYSVRVSVLYR